MLAFIDVPGGDLIVSNPYRDLTRVAGTARRTTRRPTRRHDAAAHDW